MAKPWEFALPRFGEENLLLSAFPFPLSSQFLASVVPLALCYSQSSSSCEGQKMLCVSPPSQRHLEACFSGDGENLRHGTAQHG